MNLEKVLMLIICFGGYLVSGYVDGVGEVFKCEENVCVI